MSQVFHDAPVDRAFRPEWHTSRLVVYAVLLIWAVICLFPIYWTLTTSFKIAICTASPFWFGLPMLPPAMGSPGCARRPPLGACLSSRWSRV